MRILIDGYNLMYAAGRLGTKLGPDGLRKVRQRFLHELADAIDPVDLHQTTIVFDANDAPEHLSPRQRHKGMTVLFAVSESDADERIEDLIQSHSDPKRLLVVSSDNRVRLAASRRRARVSTSDEFLTHLETLKAKRSSKNDAPPPQPERPLSISEAESAYWVQEFKEVDESPELRETFSAGQLLTEDEIRKIEREVAREEGPASWSPSKGRRPPKKS